MASKERLSIKKKALVIDILGLSKSGKMRLYSICC
jgi:hypothetical protein